jgi:GAF domain-containing protein
VSEISAPKQTLWETLTVPHPDVTALRRRRRVRMLTFLALALVVISLPLVFFATFFRAGSIPLFAWSIPALALVSYLLSRTPRPEVGAWLFVGGLAVLSPVFLITTFNPDAAPLALIVVLIPVVLSTLILDARATIILASLTLVGIIALSIFVPALAFSRILLPFIAIIFLSAMASAAALIRERDIQSVEHRAGEVDVLRKSLEQDVERIAVMAEVGRTITGTRDLDALLEQIVTLITKRFDFYHAQVFLVDDAKEYAVLRESTGTAGQQLKERGHRLAVGSQSVIGQVTQQGTPVIASDTDTDPVHRRNELLPHTRSEMALPLRVSGRVIGALDIQSVNPNAFKETDVSVFQTMADQLAIAIENARLFQQAQRDLRDIEMLNRQLTGEAWSRYLKGRAKAAPVGFKVDKGKVRTLTEDDEEKAEPRQEGTLSLPLTVRGETIGMLDLASRSGEPPDQETQAMLEAVAERVAQALDSARLGEQAQRQAAREQILSELSAELQATTDLNIILRIVAREVSRALGTSRGFVHLAAEYGPETPASD